ncbi:MAG TPA: TonB-dependent receptor [Polyangiales bacterium]|nr:TonB-dependent receptor [Polyangiales bacterium]
MREISKPVLGLAAWLAIHGTARAQAEQPPKEPADAPVVEAPSLRPDAHMHPPYPPDGDGEPARVLLQIEIDVEGRVVNAEVLAVDREDEQAARFSELALRYMRGLAFEPARRDGLPVPAIVRFEVLFDPPEHSHDEAAATTHPQHTHEVEPKAKPAAAARTEPGFSATAVVAPSDISASSIDLTGEEIRLRPYISTGDLLNAAPGFFSIQHAGGGKANQYFLLGFDGDHGTDVGFYVDGIPINWVSHGHGQGYTDLHFVIPELIQRMEVRKGPYYGEYGDFATAGTVNLVLDSEKPMSSLSVGGGTYRTFRGVGIISPKVEKVKPLLAVEVFGTDGPFENPEDLLRTNVFARTTFDLRGKTTLALTGTAYLNDWNASGQIPLREVQAGNLERFGSIDPNEGGQTQRYSLYLNVDAPAKPGTHGERSIGGEGLSLVGWVIHSRFVLYSNFTFFANDPVNGDMIRQGDDRTAVGMRAKYGFTHRFDKVILKSRMGANFRFDAIDNTLQDAPAREITNTRVDANIGQGSVGIFGEEELAWKWLRLIGGLRFDYFVFNVTDRLEDRGTLGTKSSGEETDGILLPKASLIVQPVEPLELFINFGRGFHSNDARGVVLGDDPVTPLAAALGWEAGARVLAWNRFQLSTVFFWLDLDSEVVWVGDEGTTEPSGETRRLGLEAQFRLEIVPWLLADLDVTWVRAEFVNNPGNANAIALAPELLVSGGLTARDARTGLSGRLGVFYIADRPATEDRFLTAEGFVRVDASFGWENRRFGVQAQVLNLLNTKWRQAQFATTGRLPGEDGPADCPSGTRPVTDPDGTFVGCEDLHFTPGWPIHFQVMATVKF